MTKLAELKAAFEAATPEDWTLFGGAVCKGRSTITIAQCYQTAVEDEWKRNSEFIALAHNLMPQLLEAVVELGRFVEYLGVAGCDGAYDREIERAVNLLENLK